MSLEAFLETLDLQITIAPMTRSSCRERRK